MRPVWVKRRGLYWRITRFRARGEYMIRLDWLNKHILFTAHGRRDVRTPVHAWGPPRPHLIVQCTQNIYVCLALIVVVQSLVVANTARWVVISRVSINR
jgi:hypothetical protein